MKFVFFGSPDFAAIVLGKLIDAGFAPLAVVCNPDKPVGRKQVITPPPVKVLAEKHGIPVIQLEKLDVTSYKLKVPSCDFAVVAAYSKIIPKDIIDIPKLGTIVVHPSLLPKYRGATPIQSAILSGEQTTGTTLFLIDEKVDHGAIIATRNLPIATNDNYEILSKKLAELSGDLLAETLPKFIAGEIKSQEQTHNEATFTKKFTTEDGFVKPEDLEEAQSKGGSIAVEIERKIRALNPDPGVWTFGLKTPFRMSENKRIKLLEGRLSPTGFVVLIKVQVEGRKPFVIKA